MERSDLQTNKHQLNNPSILDYAADASKSNYCKNVNDGERKPFGVNRHRFDGDDNGVPGAGNYVLPGSCNIREPGQVHAS